MVGASAGVYGIMAIFCSMHPMEELRTWFYFFPITIRAYVLLVFLGLYSLYGAIIPFDGVAHGAHLGGLLVGIIYVRGGHQFLEKLPRFSLFRKEKRPKPTAIGSLAKHSPWKRESQTFISDEIDPILDKISAQGIDSLTEHERKLLEEARKKMR